MPFKIYFGRYRECLKFRASGFVTNAIACFPSDKA